MPSWLQSIIDFFLEPEIPVGDGADAVVDFLRDNAGIVFDLFAWLLDGPIETLESILLFPPALLSALIAGAIAWRVRSLAFGVYTVLALFLIQGMGMWEQAMATLALVIIATLVALLFAIPLGILAASSRQVSVAFRPILDFMQTLPVFVYLLPAVFFFGVGIIPGVMATLIFAMPPGVRLTELGIREVDPEVVEAAEAFGSNRWQTLVRVQLPLAMPTIMAGVNQVIMLALSMVVIAGMIGAGGLGAEVVRGLSRVDVGLGFEGGLAVVIIAIFLDRISEAVGRNADRSRQSA